jgi:hypothetical protein
VVVGELPNGPPFHALVEECDDDDPLIAAKQLDTLCQGENTGIEGLAALRHDRRIAKVADMWRGRLGWITIADGQAGPPHDERQADLASSLVRAFQTCRRRQSGSGRRPAASALICARCAGRGAPDPGVMSRRTTAVRRSEVRDSDMLVGQGR